jgi:flagellar biosynthesis/type III secretory pathway M-ring protein FliF/YscJ
MSFSGRLAEDYAAKSWRSQWWLLDGWMALLYLAAFSAIAFLWRPSANNRRLAMSDEIAQDEEDAEDYDLESLEHRTRALEDDDDNSTLVGSTRRALPSDGVVFEIGDEDDEEEMTPKNRQGDRPSIDEHSGDTGERDALINGDAQSRSRDD